MKVYIFACLIFLPFIVFAEIGQNRPTVLKTLGKYFDIKRFEDRLTTLQTDSVVTLEKLMLTGERPQVWNETTKFIGIFAADWSYYTSLSSISETNRSAVIELLNPTVNRLKKWLEENTATEESILALLPERQRQHADANRLKQKAQECRQLLDKQESVATQSLTSNRIIYDEQSHPKVDLNNDFVVGPSSLSTAIFLADLIANYYQMAGVVEHIDQYKVVDISSTLGHSYIEHMRSLTTTFDDKKFFKEVSLLTGWELLRRGHSKDRITLLERRGSTSIEDSLFQSGLRLINNRNIDNINFLMVVALALIF